MIRPIIVAILLSAGSPVLAQPVPPIASSGASPANGGCAPGGGLSFICGITNAEDIVVLPGSRTLIVSSFAAGPRGLYVVDAVGKTASPVRNLPPRHDAGRYPGCASPPGELFAHGLSLREGDAGRLTLLVVNHGGRETIEVFEASQPGPSVAFTWVGCVPMPEGLAANSVAALPDGSMLATVLTHPGTTNLDYRQGRNTGAVYLWKAGSPSFVKLAGTELPGNNGIEAAADGRTFYVAATGTGGVHAYSLADPGRPLWSVRFDGMTADNLRLMADGRLLVAGSKPYDASCGGPSGPPPGAPRCPRGYIVGAVDTTRRTGQIIAEGPPNPLFLGVSASVQVGDTLWLGTARGDRLAYRKLP